MNLMCKGGLCNKDTLSGNSKETAKSKSLHVINALSSNPLDEITRSKKELPTTQHQ